MADVFRKEYHDVTEEQKALMDNIKTQAQSLHDLYDQVAMFNSLNGGRAIAIAKTELETSVMWAVKAVTA